MKHTYFVIVDTTQPNDSTKYAWYFSRPCMNDLACCVMQFARSNKTEPDKIRLYVFESKKEWSKSYDEYIKRFTARVNEELKPAAL